MLSVLSQLATLPAVTALLLAVAVVIKAIGGVIREVLNFRLVRRALKGKRHKAPLHDLAEVFAAQRSKRLPWPGQKKDAPLLQPHDQALTLPSGSQPPNAFDQRPAA
jgi:hypothetical protein